ncbi:myo-inositol-1-phosphate synthase [Stackebrandtia albiflava]|uniref:Myo-inositol-1-phosphate synthase n=1 Tax=Stackebrandtia albiflava TaxID=406432 RepID=A0A562VAU8_9ACTN|nr:inositol-3-phosphate synthase [Stackebrandtia albiflava]TWJ14978.1 myo-inositol-1-phosphate synthase [Stackebrandtia albiflava]
MVIRVGVVGVGNCASSLVQGVEYYRKDPGAAGLAAPECDGHLVSDVEFSAAFDVDEGKIGRDLSEAIYVAPNNSHRFADVPHLSVPVDEGVLADGVADSVAGRFTARGTATVSRIADRLTATGTRILVNLLPVGAQRATETYAEAALLAGCGFVNCMPATLARDPGWATRFADAGVPLVGDDLSSGFGATVVHRAVLDALAAGGVRLRQTFQLNHGGNMDFLTMQDPERLRTKQDSKSSGMHRGGSAAATHVGAQYVPFLADTKVAYIRVDAVGFGGTPVEVELKMSVEDSPSAAGNVLDAIRRTAAAMDRRESGVLAEVSAAFMKAPGGRF